MRNAAVMNVCKMCNIYHRGALAIVSPFIMQKFPRGDEMWLGETIQ